MAKIHQGGNPLGLENHVELLSGNPNAWSHQVLHGARSQNYEYGMEMRRLKNISMHRSGTHLLQYVIWNEEHLEFVNADDYVHDMMSSGTNAASGMGCHTSAYKDL